MVNCFTGIVLIKRDKMCHEIFFPEGGKELEVQGKDM